jgi:hypothetical protein
VKHCEIQLHIVEIDEERNTMLHKWSSRLLARDNEPFKFPDAGRAQFVAEFMLKQGKAAAEQAPPTQTTPAQ